MSSAFFPIVKFYLILTLARTFQSQNENFRTLLCHFVLMTVVTVCLQCMMGKLASVAVLCPFFFVGKSWRVSAETCVRYERVSHLE